MMVRGLWVVFEGPDGVGKSTAMRAVASALRLRLPDVEIIETKHPGSTALGQHIRDLVKYPDKYGFDIDSLSSQMLMFIDHVNFKSTVLCPAIERGAIILADRCDLVSGLTYGTATGLNVQQLNALMQLACGPRIDILYILRCQKTTQEQRLTERYALDGITDRFETKTVREKVNQAYERLMTDSVERTIMLNRIVALDNIKYIETDGSITAVAEQCACELNARYLESLCAD